jgi:hypothetical protein
MKEQSMDARCNRIANIVIVLTCLGCMVASGDCFAGGYRTENFVVSAPTAELAREIGDAAEVFRRDLGIEWLGEEMPRWSKPCPIHARVAPNLGAGGATSFVFDRGEVFGWRMNIQGNRQRILDSVLPHEVTHTIFASYFRQPLPRWADEGACTTVEHSSEIAKQERMLIEFLKTGRGIPFSQMFAMKDYPRDVMPLYSQGHSLAQMLIELRGRRAFLAFLADGMQDENWPRAVRAHYGHSNLLTLQNNWLDWVRQGRPRLGPASQPGTELASATAPPTVFRGQSPDPPATGSPAQTMTPIPPANSSIYSAMAARTSTDSAATPSVTSRQSVYDSSARQGILRR